MIQATFEFGGDIIIAEVDGHNLMFMESETGQMAPVEGLKFDKQGVLEEFPDLEGEENWKEKAIERFKEHIKELDNEKDRISYVIEELTKCGYKPLYKQRKGFRPKKL